eukprot:CAMPEP_0172882180 /NCGR_PEP_ID=MMETSP1075-20121228/119462_1 /TAXON_ID=2916 /ORGANISM="Ceratium fusus, Strain PA161109" /LENGTH=31 /DNA_ID= /DNA_START= /DNA_END= /DNA_ORIENTATION=
MWMTTMDMLEENRLLATPPHSAHFSLQKALN